MKPALGFRQPCFPQSWGKIPAGDRILSAIDIELTPWWPKFFGYHLLKIGALSSELNTVCSPIKHQVNVVANSCENHNNDVVADIDDLPFLQHSVDVCVLSHALEFSLDPHHVVREANRVLIPNGYMVITGFNPFSAAGFNKLIPYRRKRFPWNERFFSANRVKDWLQLMGYEILADQRTIYGSLQKEENLPILQHYWQRFASKYLKCMGSVYVIVAKKRRHPLTPIKPKWQLRPNFKPANVPSMNSSNRMKKSHDI
jgi:SAM-dependent methyltransferase